MSLKLVSWEFEIFGKVQGVFFRKCTQKQAKLLGITGWIKNTSRGTVKGVIEGPTKKIEEIQTWLQTQGSPKSNIVKALFHNKQEICNRNFDTFAIKY
ncbi:acylphosphatase-1-like [Aethina tumida]|uniref:acylphosphatase-1-like n=1 Tax=Aethina tumida TaxID=116153 RepID=UPI002147DF65|nr:acylphosphatase-1-like [Aethina tumida]